MKIKDLVEKKRTLDITAKLVGYTAKFGKMKRDFELFMESKYNESQVSDPTFLDEEVPQEVIEAFRPIYDIYRENYEGVTGTRIEPLPSMTRP